MSVLVNLYITFYHAFSGKAFFKLLLCVHDQFRIEQVKETIIFGVVLGEHLSCKPPHSSICYETSKSVAVSYRAGLFLPNPCFNKLFIIVQFTPFSIIVLLSGYLPTKQILVVLSLCKSELLELFLGTIDAHQDPIFKELELLIKPFRHQTILCFLLTMAILFFH